LTAKQNNFTAWATLALTVLGALGTAVYQFATLKADVRAQGSDIAYIKGRIDGAPATPQLPLTQVRRTPLDSLGRTASANPGHQR
jgi:hypothetical protein